MGPPTASDCRCRKTKLTAITSVPATSAFDTTCPLASTYPAGSVDGSATAIGERASATSGATCSIEMPEPVSVRQASGSASPRTGSDAASVKSCARGRLDSRKTFVVDPWIASRRPKPSPAGS